MPPDFYERKFEEETQRELMFAAKLGFTVEEAGGFWRVYKPKVLPMQDKAACQVAMCTTESTAARVANALAVVATNGPRYKTQLQELVNNALAKYGGEESDAAMYALGRFMDYPGY